MGKEIEHGADEEDRVQLKRAKLITRKPSTCNQVKIVMELILCSSLFLTIKGITDVNMHTYSLYIKGSLNNVRVS